MDKLQLYYPACLTKQALVVATILKSRGYDIALNDPEFDERHLGIAMFEKDMEVDAYLKEIPFLKEQLDYSSIKHLRILPFFFYDGSKDNPEALFEGKTGEFVEAIFSGEFKPYGWDVSSKDNIDELIELIEENYAE